MVLRKTIDRPSYRKSEDLCENDVYWHLACHPCAAVGGILSVKVVQQADRRLTKSVYACEEERER